MEQLDEVIAQSDYLVVSLALTPQTRHFIKEANLKHAKKGQIFINVGRGLLVDEDALIRCLKDGTLAGAALDVVSVEPLPQESEIWDLENVLLSPHNCDYLADSRPSSIRFFTENCARFLAGQELENQIDKKSGY